MSTTKDSAAAAEGDHLVFFMVCQFRFASLWQSSATLLFLTMTLRADLVFEPLLSLDGLSTQSYLTKGSPPLLFTTF